MKLSCLQDNLAEGLGLVGRVVASKSTLPVLGNVLLATDQGQLKLAATNLELAFTYWIGAKIESEGAITLPARLLADYVGLLDKGQRVDMELHVASRKVRLRCGRFEANIAGLEAEDFPLIPTVSGGMGFNVEAGALKAAIAQVVFAAAQDDSRPALTGVLLSLKGQQLTLAAADGFRLGVRRLELAEAPPEPLSVIVPARTLSEVARVLPDGEGDLVEIATTANRNQILFRFDRTEVVSRLIEGQFPDYQRIIPSSARATVAMNTQELLKAARAAAVFARDSNMIVRLELQPSKEELGPGRVIVTSSSAEVGDNTAEVDASVDGEAMQVSFNARYLRDVLEALGAPQVLLQLTGPSSPGVFKPGGGDPTAYTHVIMPMAAAR
ncbi:MAG: DNA polymerase III subunit beta [Chloroflexi bacterium]|nr:DNA polymerase III subunit beta [Chloroflexota bacterium]